MFKKSKPGKGNETNDPKCQCSLHNHRERNYSTGLENFNLTSGPWEDKENYKDKNKIHLNSFQESYC